MIDVLSVAISLPVGAAVAAYVTHATMSKKFQSDLNASKERSNAELQEVERRRQQEAVEHLRHHEEVVAQLEKSLADANKSLAIREGEIDSLASWEAAFLQCDKSTVMHDLFVRSIERSFTPRVFGCMLFAADDKWTVLAADGRAHELTVQDAVPPNLLSKSVFDQHAPVSTDLETLPKVAEAYPGAKAVTIMPLSCRERKLGLAVIVWNTNYYQEDLRLVRRLAEAWGRTQFRIELYEEEVNSSRSDRLTGLPNNKYFDEFAPHVLRLTSPERPASILLIECDNLKEINDRYGHVVGDAMIKQLAGVIQASARLNELHSQKRPLDHFFRYTGLQFVAILEDTNPLEACTVAERIRTAVENKRDWAGGVPKWSISTGVITCPLDGTNCHELKIRAEVALMYVRERLGGNQTVHFNNVPRTFRVSKLSARVGGSLNVFDPCTVLQSMQNSGKTGILTVKAPDGKAFWAFFENYRLVKAHLAGFKGDTAVVEFISTFEDGEFNFQEFNTLDSTGLEDLHRMDMSYNVTKPLERLLIEGIGAQETLSEARRTIPEPKLFVRPSGNAQELLGKLQSSAEPLSKEELELLSSIWKQINGRTMWSAIVDRMDAVPTYMRWHAGSILVRHRIVELSKFGVTYSV